MAKLLDINAFSIAEFVFHCISFHELVQLCTSIKCVWFDCSVFNVVNIHFIKTMIRWNINKQLKKFIQICKNEKNCASDWESNKMAKSIANLNISRVNSLVLYWYELIWYTHFSI